MTIRLMIITGIILATGLAVRVLLPLILELLDRWSFQRDLNRWVAELDAEQEEQGSGK